MIRFPSTRAAAVLRGALFAVGGTLFVGLLALTGALQSVEWMTYDARLRWRNADKPAPDSIAVILIDEASLQYMNSDAGRWPWPRSVHADLLDFLALGHPRAVIFDVLLVENQRELDDPAPLGAHDERLIEATERSGITWHAMQLLAEAQDERGTDVDATRVLPEDFVAQHALEHGAGGATADAVDADTYNMFQIPFDGLWQAARGMGVVRADPDADGRYRRMQLLYPFQGGTYPALALAPVLDLLQSDTENGDAEIDIPVDRDGKVLVNQYGRFPAYSYGGLIASLKQVNAGEVEHLLVNPEEFRDRIVFIGADAVGVQDLKATPLSPKTAGVYLQASVTGNLLTRDFLLPAPATATALLTVLLALAGAFAALALRRLSLKLGALLGVFAAYTGAALLAFRSGLVLDMVAPLLAAFVAWFTAFSFLFFTEGKDKRRVRTVLAQYVSPAVLAEVVDKYEYYMQAEIGRKETVSVLFSDIRSFTTLSENLPAEKVVEMLNIYFSAMTDVIFAHQGTIDKFIGDAIMAFWGAPVRNDAHALLAVRTALEMLRILPEVNARIVARGIPAIDIGVGINTGDAVLGNIGSEKKLAYTAIGDNVNLASRLEGLTKSYGCPVLIADNTHAQVRDEIACRIVDMVRVKGKTLPIRIYAPLAATTAPERAAAAALCETTARAFALYQQRDWTQALTLYQSLPADRVRAIFIQRCHDHLRAPPPQDWDGAHTLTSK